MTKKQKHTFEIEDGKIKVGRFAVSVERDEMNLNPFEEFDQACSVVFKTDRDHGRDTFHDNGNAVGDWEFFESFAVQFGRHATASPEEITLDTYTNNGAGEGQVWVFFDFVDSKGIRVDADIRPVLSRDEIENFDGFAYLDASDIRRVYGAGATCRTHWKRAAALIRSELEQLGAYLSGDVYYFTVEDADGDSVESVGGFYEYGGAELPYRPSFEGLPYVWQAGIEAAEQAEQNAKDEDAAENAALVMEPS